MQPTKPPLHCSPSPASKCACRERARREKGKKESAAGPAGRQARNGPRWPSLSLCLFPGRGFLGGALPPPPPPSSLRSQAGWSLLLPCSARLLARAPSLLSLLSSFLVPPCLPLAAQRVPGPAGTLWDRPDPTRPLLVSFPSLLSFSSPSSSSSSSSSGELQAAAHPFSSFFFFLAWPMPVPLPRPDCLPAFLRAQSQSCLPARMRIRFAAWCCVCGVLRNPRIPWCVRQAGSQ